MNFAISIVESFGHCDIDCSFPLSTSLPFIVSNANGNANVHGVLKFVAY